MTDPSRKLPDIDAMMQVADRIERACATDPALRDAQLDEVLRLVPGKRAIAKGTFSGRPAVFRMFLDADSSPAAREWDEMQRIWPEMQSGPYRIAEPLHYSPDHALLVIEHVEGTPLMQHIYGLNPTDRPGLVRGPAEWLHRYTTPSLRMGGARAPAWLKRAEEASARQPHPKLQHREAKILRHLRRLAPAAKEQDWRYAICHGDFHPNNLIINGARLTGIDTGGSASMPVYKDMARFLAHMGRRGLLPSGKARFGVDLEGLNAFGCAFDLSHWEREITLPFLIGCEALLRIEHKDMKRSRIRRAAAMYDLLLDDLAQI